MSNELYTLAEVEKKFGIPVPTLRYWIKTKKIHAIKGDEFNPSIIKISREEILSIPTYIRARYKKITTN